MSKMLFKPINDQLFVVPVEENSSPIIRPETARAVEIMLAVVLSVGRGHITAAGVVALDIKPGDHVLFGGHLGTQVKIGDVAGLILREGQVLGTFQPVIEPLIAEG